MNKELSDPHTDRGRFHAPVSDITVSYRSPEKAAPESHMPESHVMATSSDSDGHYQDVAQDNAPKWRFWKKSKHAESSVRDTLEDIIEDRAENGEAISSHERILLANILDQRDVTAYDVMVPSADITAVDAKTPVRDVTTLMAERGHSRLPVYRGSLDDVIGMVHIKDVLPVVAEGKDVPLASLVRKVLFVSPSMRVLDLMLEMRIQRTHMALVVDEYGGIGGLATIEDVVEQIVGEIEDEHDDVHDASLNIQADGSVIADARYTLEDFEKRFGSMFSDEEKDEIDTLGGLVFVIGSHDPEHAGSVPGRKALFTHAGSGMEFEVLDADPRRIKKLRIRNIPANAPDSA
jgi:CBS domain containing-hemolysin-like protein